MLALVTAGPSPTRVKVLGRHLAHQPGQPARPQADLRVSYPHFNALGQLLARSEPAWRETACPTAPQEFDAIRSGEADATVSQPADLYAKYGLQYLKEAIAGKTFAAGPTDHNSTIVEVAPGVLEDQLDAPLVTKENVDDKALWGNNL